MRRSGTFKTLVVLIAITFLALSGCSIFNETDESVVETDAAGRPLRTVKFTPGATIGNEEDDRDVPQGGDEKPATNRPGKTSAPADRVDKDDGNDVEYTDAPDWPTDEVTPTLSDDFTPNPTDPPVDPWEHGNSPENITYGGYAAEKDGWIYYRNNADNGYLYKIRTDGSEKTLVLDTNVWSINIVGNWIYFLNVDRGYEICRVRPDGTGKLGIGNNYISRIYAVGDWIYYQERYGGMFKQRNNGTEKNYLGDQVNNNTSAYTILGDTLYFINVIGRSALYKVNIFDRSTSMIGNSATLGIKYYSIIGDYIYFTNEFDGFYKIRTDGVNINKVNDLKMRYIHAEADKVYFIDMTGNICVANLDGSGLTQLTGPVQVENGYNIVSDWIYYFDASGCMRRVKTYGTEDQLVD